MLRESILAHEDSGRCHAEVPGLCATGKGHYALMLGEDSRACEAFQGSTPGSHSSPGHRHKPAHTFSSEAVWSIKREDLVAISPSCVCTVILFSSDLNMFFFVPFPLVRKTLWGKLDDSELFWAWIRMRRSFQPGKSWMQCSKAEQIPVVTWEVVQPW